MWQRFSKAFFELALDTSNDDDKRLTSWEQAIRLAPESPRILEAASKLFTPQLAPAVGAKAIESLQAARATGLADQLLAARKQLGPTISQSIIRLLLNRAETTTTLLNAIEQDEFNLQNYNWISVKRSSTIPIVKLPNEQVS